MGYRDNKLALSKTQTVAADADSTYYIDTEITNPGLDRGSTLGVVINVERAPTGVNTTGINFIVCHKNAEPTTADADLVTMRVPSAQILKKAEFVVLLPIGVTILRYIRLYYDLITGDETGAIFSAYLTPIQVTGSPN